MTKERLSALFIISLESSILEKIDIEDRLTTGEAAEEAINKFANF